MQREHGETVRPVEIHHAPRVHAPETVAITGGRPAHGPDAPLNPPVVFSSSYHAGGPVAYSRDGNPTWDAFEEVLGQLEGGEALAFASGMAAVAAVFDTLPTGATVAVADGYSGTRALLTTGVGPDDRWDVRFVDVVDTDSTLAACEGAALLWLESPTNPRNGIADLRALASGAHERGTLVAVDNTYSTPLHQRPLELGADVVVHSATKLLAGHSDVLLGATVARRQDLCGALRKQRSLRGAVPGPLETFLALRGVRSLPVRLERASANALELARRLRGHPDVEHVRYPGLPDDPGHARAAAQMDGFGTMVAFEVRGGAAPAEAAAKATRLIVHATSLGGIETTMERRARWPDEGDRLPPGLIRLSVGCEHVDDLWDDLVHALRIAAALG
jgi:cystathionine gamma-synthase